MSIKVMSEVWEHCTDLKGSALVVMLALADHADDGGICWPAVPTIAKKARISADQTRRIIRTIENHGYIERNERSGRSTIYRVTPRANATPRADAEGPPAPTRGRTIKEASKEPSIVDDVQKTNGNGSVFDFYQSNIGILTAYDTELIKDAIDTYGGPVVIEAMKVAITANVRKWRYVMGILKRWKTEGMQSAQPKKDKSKRTIVDPLTGERLEVMA